MHFNEKAAEKEIAKLKEGRYNYGGTAQAVKTTASSAASTIIDNQLMGELNRHKKLTEKYIAMGYSQAEAQHLALNSMGRGLLQEIISEIMGEKLAIGRNDDEGAQ